jgi:outer membrane protein assembly factor BamB
MNRREFQWRVPGHTEVKELGRGAQGRVVLARRDDTGELVAIKYLAEGLLSDPRAVQMFRHEAETLARVRDSNIARLEGYVEAPGGGAAIVMEAVDGVPLRRVLDDHDGPLPVVAALAVLKGSLLGLAAAHAVGVVHRDYKPANVIVDARGWSKLIDFGIAVLTGQGGGAGTPGYMAPEQWRGEPATPATDLYAATCVFFECVTGRRPYAGADMATVRERHLTAPVPVEDVPEPVRPLVERGMSKTPGGRSWDARRFVTELETTAIAAYGLSWERHGWTALGAAAAALASAFPTAALGTAAVTGVKSLVAQLGGVKAAASTGIAATVVTTVLLWPPTPPPYVPAWNTDAIVPTSELYPVRGGFVTYGRTKADRHEMIKLDARTGAVRWRHPLADDAYASNGESPVRGDTAVALQRGTRGGLQIAAVDTDTGRVRWRHAQEGLFLSHEEADWCAPRRICLHVVDTIRPPSTFTHRIRVLDAATGARLSESGPIGVVPLGEGLYDSVDHRQIVRTTVHGRELWRRPISEIFGDVAMPQVYVTEEERDGRTWTSAGYRFDFLIEQRDGRYIGEVGSFGRYDVSRKVQRLDGSVVAGFDAATGRKLWSSPGTSVLCGELEFTLDHPVRCRRTGWLDASSGPDTNRWRLRNADVILEGFDPATGRTRWSWRAGAVRGLVLDWTNDVDLDTSVIRVDDRTYLIRTPHSGTVLLDLRTGPRPVRGTPTAWCDDSKFHLYYDDRIADREFFRRPQPEWWPCDAQGRRVALPGAIPDFAGARSGDTYAWRGGRGVQAVLVRDGSR